LFGPERRVDDGEREAEAVGDGVPAVVVGEVQDLLALGVEQRDPFAAVLEAAGELAGDARAAAVAGAERRQAVVPGAARAPRRL